MYGVRNYYSYYMGTKGMAHKNLLGTKQLFIVYVRRLNDSAFCVYKQYVFAHW